MRTPNRGGSRDDATFMSPNEQAAFLAGKYITFKLSAEEYGLQILAVREIIRLMDITRVPKSKDFLCGVINLRGKVIPVVDLRRKFGMESAPPTEQTVIIVVQCTNETGTPLTMGILVDEVLEVLSLQGEEIEPPPSGTSIDADFILGIGKTEKSILFLLDIAKVLTTDQIEDMTAAVSELSS